MSKEISTKNLTLAQENVAQPPVAADPVATSYLQYIVADSQMIGARYADVFLGGWQPDNVVFLEKVAGINYLLDEVQADIDLLRTHVNNLQIREN